MHQIPDTFFDKETRLDFEIDETMKKAWAIQLTVLDRILEIAEGAGIKVWLDYGSLLGAVRHKGYIPWDDDIDICVMRADYLSLLFLLKRKLPDFMKVRSLYTTEKYTQPKGFISNRDIIDLGKDPVQKEISDIYFGLPYIAGVDLYPLDYTPADIEQCRLLRNIYLAVYDLAQRFDTYKESGELEGFALQLEELLNVHIERDDSMQTSLWKLADSISMMTPKEEADSALWYPDGVIRNTDMRRPLSLYDETIYVDFEYLKAPIPAGYDEVLKICYGEDYMTPVRAESTHEYPFYKEQQEIIDRRNTPDNCSRP